MVRYKVIEELIKNKLQNNLGAEIGVWKGETTEYLLNKFKNLRLYCIDPYRVYPHYAAFHSLGEYSTQAAMNKLYGKVRSKLKKFGNRCLWSRKESVEAAKEARDNSLDFVFLDGNWGFSYVLEDIEAWYPKVRIGGILIGHRINSNKDSPLCVKRAVESHFGDNYKVMEGRWYHIKKEDDMVKKKAVVRVRETEKPTPIKHVKTNVTVKVTKNKTAYKAPKKTLPALIADFFNNLPSLQSMQVKKNIHIVKSVESLAKDMGQYSVVFAEGILENTQHCIAAMWDLIRLTKYKGYVACVVEIGEDKIDNFYGEKYFRERFIPKFGFTVKLLKQEGNKIYFVGQTG